MSLEYGKYYRIKLASVDYTWKEDVKYFKYIPATITKSGIIQDNLVANNITISNANINQSINVVAGNSIHFLSGTHLTDGHYSIDENLCMNLTYTYNNAESKTENYKSNFNENVLTKTESKAKEIINELINIYPNPNNGQFSVRIDNYYEIVTLELVNPSGTTILKVTDNKNNYTFDLSNYSNGIYFLKMNLNSGFMIQKVIYQ